MQRSASTSSPPSPRSSNSSSVLPRAQLTGYPSSPFFLLVPSSFHPALPIPLPPLRFTLNFEPAYRSYELSRVSIHLILSLFSPPSLSFPPLSPRFRGLTRCLSSSFFPSSRSFPRSFSHAVTFPICRTNQKQ
jgi:hypothetical protein